MNRHTSHLRPFCRQRLPQIAAGLVVPLLLSFGSGCGNGGPPGTAPSTQSPPPQQTKDPVDILASFTPQEMAEILHAELESLAEDDPRATVVAEVSFKDAIPASRLLRLLTKNRLAATASIHYEYGEGSGWARIPQGADVPSLLGELYETKLRRLAFEIERADDGCAKPSISPCGSGGLLAEQKKTFALLKARGELYVNALGIKGSAPNILSLWNDEPEVFAVRLSPGSYLYNIPLYPETDMRYWK